MAKESFTLYVYLPIILCFMAQKRYLLLEIIYKTAFLSERIDNFVFFSLLDLVIYLA